MSEGTTNLVYRNEHLSKQVAAKDAKIDEIKGELSGAESFLLERNLELLEQRRDANEREKILRERLAAKDAQIIILRDYLEYLAGRFRFQRYGIINSLGEFDCMSNKFLEITLAVLKETEPTNE